MKKLLAITLVLGLAVAANAVTVTPEALTVDMGSSISIIVSNDTKAAYDWYIELTNDVAASLTNEVLPGAGGLGEIEGPTAPAVNYPNTWHFIAAGGPGSEPVAGADHFKFTYTALDDHSLVDLWIYDNQWTDIVQTISIQNTPEPMTLGLLGLGGLFLRRRK